jgi:hypothetical protein
MAAHKIALIASDEDNDDTGELVDRYRLELQDVTVGVRKSWEEMFRYTFRQYPEDTELNTFDLGMLSERLLSSDINPQIVEGYMKRWRDLLTSAKSI